MSDTRRNSALVILTAIVLVVVLMYPATSTLVEYQTIDGTLVFEGNYVLTDASLVSGSLEGCLSPYTHDGIIAWVQGLIIYYYVMENQTLVGIPFIGSQDDILRVWGVGNGFICYDFNLNPYLYFIGNATHVDISTTRISTMDVSGSRVAWISDVPSAQWERKIYVFNAQDWSTTVFNDDPTVFNGVVLQEETNIFIDGTLLAYVSQNRTLEKTGTFTHEIISDTFSETKITADRSIFGLYDYDVGVSDGIGNYAVYDTWDDEYECEYFSAYKRGSCFEDDVMCLRYYYPTHNYTLSLKSMTFDGNPEICNATTNVGCTRNGIEKLDNGTYAITYMTLGSIYSRFLTPYEEEVPPEDDPPEDDPPEEDEGDGTQEEIDIEYHTENKTLIGTTPATEEGGELSWVLIIAVVVSAMGIVYYLAKKKKGGADYYEK